MEITLYIYQILAGPPRCAGGRGAGLYRFLPSGKTQTDRGTLNIAGSASLKRGKVGVTVTTAPALFVGAIFSLFNRVSLSHLRFDRDNCTACNLCRSRCEMGAGREERQYLQLQSLHRMHHPRGDSSGTGNLEATREPTLRRSAPPCTPQRVSLPEAGVAWTPGRPMSQTARRSTRARTGPAPPRRRDPRRPEPTRARPASQRPARRRAAWRCR